MLRRAVLHDPGPDSAVAPLPISESKRYEIRQKRSAPRGEHGRWGDRDWQELPQVAVSSMRFVSLRICPGEKQIRCTASWAPRSKPCSLQTLHSAMLFPAKEFRARLRRIRCDAQPRAAHSPRATSGEEKLSATGHKRDQMAVALHRGPTVSGLVRVPE